MQSALLQDLEERGRTHLPFAVTVFEFLRARSHNGRANPGASEAGRTGSLLAKRVEAPMVTPRKSPPKAAPRGLRKHAKKSKAAAQPGAKKARPQRSLVIGNEHIETPAAAKGEQIPPSKSSSVKTE